MPNILNLNRSITFLFFSFFYQASYGKFVHFLLNYFSLIFFFNFFSSQVETSNWVPALNHFHTVFDGVVCLKVTGLNLDQVEWDSLLFLEPGFIFPIHTVKRGEAWLQGASDGKQSSFVLTKIVCFLCISMKTDPNIKMTITFLQCYLTLLL